MTDIRRPRKGSMAFRPRKRAESQVPKVCWPTLAEKRVLGFAGYKAGMIQIACIDDTESPTKGQEVVTPATVIEVPPVVVYGIRGYKEKRSVKDLLVEDAKVLSLLKIKKKLNSAKEISKEEVDDVYLLVFTTPDKTTIGKKHIERMELGLGGETVEEKLEQAKALLGKEVKASEIFKPGEFVDVIAITKGKGWQGTIKRFGTTKQRRKATGKVRHIGCLGPFHPGYVQYTVPHAGQTGYHKRTELNKRIFKIDANLDEINPKGGFMNYGFVKNEYIIIKGSVPGPVKRLIRLRVAMRANGGVKEPVIKDVIVG